jgi:ribosomal protein S18 acetylase RimI-like enzyme
MEQLNIRVIGIDDVVTLQKIARETFSEMFADYNSADNLKKYLDEKFTVTKLSEELNHPHSKFYFAQIGDEVVGYLKTNTGEAQTELMNLNAFEIQRIYVLQAYHGKKVGQLLIEKALEEARKTTCTYVWLGVWQENHRAIGFYSKNGFIKFDTHIFKMGDEEQMDWLMKLDL